MQAVSLICLRNPHAGIILPDWLLVIEHAGWMDNNGHWLLPNHHQLCAIHAATMTLVGHLLWSRFAHHHPSSTFDHCQMLCEIRQGISRLFCVCLFVCSVFNGILAIVGKFEWKSAWKTIRIGSSVLCYLSECRVYEVIPVGQKLNLRVSFEEISFGYRIIELDACHHPLRNGMIVIVFLHTPCNGEQTNSFLRVELKIFIWQWLRWPNAIHSFIIIPDQQSIFILMMTLL